MQTKAHQRLAGRIVSYSTDFEIANVLVRDFEARADSRGSLATSLNAPAASHPKLHTRRNTEGSRRIVGRHLKKTLYVSFIKDLYEDFGEYLSNILNIAALAGVDPARFAGDVKIELKATEILSAGDWPNSVRLISDKIFRQLENERSTTKLIEKIDAKLGLAVPRATIDAALPYLDARHIFVHRDGVSDALYRVSYPGIPLDRSGKLKANYNFVISAQSAVSALAKALDDRLIDLGLVREDDLVG